MPHPEKISVENVNHPGKVECVDAVKYVAMRRALLTVVPAQPPGLSFNELRVAVLPHLPDELWPGGGKVGWWLKSTQLDLEAKGLLKRSAQKPLTWYQPTPSID